MPGFVYTAVLAVVLPLVVAQVPPTPSSWPHDYPGKPSGDFSPEWQSCRQSFMMCCVWVLMLSTFRF